MTDYVLGFLFSPDLSEISLIRKKRPEWQAGKLNGLGGKIHKDEKSDAAMQREFKEEAGLQVTTWKQFARLQGEGWDVACFAAVADQALVELIHSMTDEGVEVHSVDEVCSGRCGTVGNIPWLVIMARTFLQGLQFIPLDIYEGARK
jgi:8-oxo-dGTP diphosphatase